MFYHLDYYNYYGGESFVAPHTTTTSTRAFTTTTTYQPMGTPNSSTIGKLIQCN
jgi:hypothetical protein